MVQAFCEGLRKYRLFLAINLAHIFVIYFASTDINFGMDNTMAFDWISNEGWMNLVNGSINLTSKEKDALLGKPNLQ